MLSSRWYRFLLSILLLLAMIWLWSSRVKELAYHTWQSPEIIDIGDARNFEDKRLSLPSNSYVSVSGTLGNKAATISGLRAGAFRFGRYQIRQLLGSKLYVEYNEQKYHSKFNPFTHISVTGRLIPFGTGAELAKVRDFFQQYYHQPVDERAMIVVVDEKPQSEIIYPVLFIASILLIVLSFCFSARAFWSR